MAKKKAFKEIARYKVQRQAEFDFKKQYRSMLINMGKTIIAQITKYAK